MKNKDNDIEEMLLNNASLDELIKMKIEKEFKNELKQAQQKPEKKIITDISQVPKSLIFSKAAVYRLFNRNTKQETFINGMQAESLIGIQHSIREKMSKGLISAFTTDDAYVKFEEIEI